MWFSIFFFTIVGVLIAAYIWENRRKKTLRRRSRFGAIYAETGHTGYYGSHGISHGGDHGSGFSGDCGGGGGGGDGGGGGGC